jgi:hypothetical protein
LQGTIESVRDKSRENIGQVGEIDPAVAIRHTGRL